MLRCRCQNLSVQIGLREHITELELEGVGVIELGGGLGALQVEPEDAVHDALVDENTVLKCLLEQAIHIVSL